MGNSVVVQQKTDDLRHAVALQGQADVGLDQLPDFLRHRHCYVREASIPSCPFFSSCVGFMYAADRITRPAVTRTSNRQFPVLINILLVQAGSIAPWGKRHIMRRTRFPMAKCLTVDPAWLGTLDAGIPKEGIMKREREPERRNPTRRLPTPKGPEPSNPLILRVGHFSME